MAGVSTARKHFGILSWTEPDYYDCWLYKDILTETQFYFYWQHFCKQVKSKFILALINPCISEDVILFLATQHNEEQKRRLLQIDAVLCMLLDALLDLRWLSFFDTCMNEVFGILKRESVIELLYICVIKLETTLHIKQSMSKCTLDLFSYLSVREHMIHFVSLTCYQILYLFC